MTAMAALSKPETFRLDVKVEDARPALLQGRRDGRLAVGRSVTEQAPSATSAAHLCRRRACGSGPPHEVVDFRRCDARRKPLSVLPFGRDLAADFVPIASFERMPHRYSRVANPFERIEDDAIAVHVSFDDLPVVRARLPWRSRVGEDKARFEGPRVHVETDAVNPADA